MRLADRLAHESPTFDRTRFLRVAMEVFAEEAEPVIGIDPRETSRDLGEMLLHRRLHHAGAKEKHPCVPQEIFCSEIFLRRRPTRS